MPRKNSYIQDLQEGHNLDDVFVIVQAKLAQSKNGPFWDLTLQDRTGRINAKIWSPQSNAYPHLVPEQVVQVQAQVRSFRDQLQVVVQRLHLIDPDQTGLDWAEFIPSSARAPEEMLTELEGMCQKHLRYPPWRKLTRKVLKDGEVRQRLLQAPGAKTIHHAYRGGLLEHTLSVVRLCLGVADLYPDLDREILLVAAILHDVGKAWELDCGLTRDYTDPGRMLGHITIGLEVITPFMDKVKDLDPGLAMHLKHLLLSHHGEYAYGSPRRPKTQEAFVLHFMDNLDAKISSLDFALSGLGEEDTGWSSYQPSLERMVYNPVRTQSLVQEQPDTKPRTGIQCSLPLKE